MSKREERPHQANFRHTLALENLEPRCLLATATIDETFRTLEFESGTGTFYYLYETPLERDEIPAWQILRRRRASGL